jgi:hypothetical protein
MADDLHKSYLELTIDRSNPAVLKEEMALFFKRRQY